ncbi:MAG: hypothetical protein KDK06_08845 [Gammaproteobacteria bacterium]|nr:hypothetical protein [Gammaproteobacteria bacterium]
MPERVVIAGWGQVTQPKSATPPYLDPVDMMERAARDAGAVAGAGIWPLVDALLVVRTQSRNLIEPGAEIAHRLGIRPAHVRVSGIGGEVPQNFVNQAAGMLARGEARAVLICGAETFYPRADTDVRGEAALIQGIPADYDAEDAVGSDAYEQRHGVTLPIHGFPLFENALWARSGLPLAAWLDKVGGQLARFSEVAAGHPNAWTRAPSSAAAITTPAPDNRPICFPYTKRMVSLVMADLGAAVLMTTEKVARSLRDGAAQAVYFRGGGFAKDHQRFLVDKADFTRSPPLVQAARKAQARAGLGVSELEGFDLYSCFPCAVNVARGELGIADDDPRALTQTGGLGYFGGPGSNYALHGIASLAENIAAGRLRSGMATALGWFMHKHAVGIYADTPGDVDLGRHDREDAAAPLAGDGPVARTEEASGGGTIETWTVVYARDQSPVRGIVYGRTDEGLRFVANSDQDDATFAALTSDNVVGRRVRLDHDPASGRNRASLDRG